MSHLTDGQLHAYLDGSVEALDGATLVEARSHIAACDDCSARLEAARLVRDEAVSLLGTAAPSSFSPPPFEELERRAALVDPVHGSAGELPNGRSSVSRRDAASGRLLWRPGSLAWAASLTVALTAGWLARGTVGTGMTDRPAVEAPSETVGLQDRQELYSLDQSALERSVDRDAGESLGGSVADEGGDDEVTLRSLARRATERSVESPSEPKEDRNAQAAAAPEFFAREGAETEADANRRRGDRVAMDEAATETGGEEAAPTDDRPAAKMARADVAGRPPAGLGAVEGTADWQPVRREQAEVLLGGNLKTVEGLPVLSVYARAAGATPEVWTAQQLASGHQLNLRQTPLGDGRFGDLEEGGAKNERAEQAADPASEMEARPQQQAYYETLESLLVDGFLIEARAPLSPDSLRALLSRLKD
jgi:hypothetical protein